MLPAYSRSRLVPKCLSRTPTPLYPRLLVFLNSYDPPIYPTIYHHAYYYYSVFERKLSDKGESLFYAVSPVLRDTMA